MNAFAFFNSGFNSGASIMHKHLQLIPYETMGDSQYIPVEQLVVQHIQENDITEKMFTLPAFDAFRHVFYQLDKDFFEQAGESME